MWAGCSCPVPPRRTPRSLAGCSLTASCGKAGSSLSSLRLPHAHAHALFLSLRPSEAAQRGLQPPAGKLPVLHGTQQAPVLALSVALPMQDSLCHAWGRDSCSASLLATPSLHSQVQPESKSHRGPGAHPGGCDRPPELPARDIDL